MQTANAKASAVLPNFVCCNSVLPNPRKIRLMVAKPHLARIGMAASPRNGTIDLLRCLSAFGVVWFHAGAPAADFALAGLAVFFLLLVLFHPPGPLSVAPVIKSRADRLLRPWLAWSAIFALAKALQA
jgi:hypothetical protein